MAEQDLDDLDEVEDLEVDELNSTLAEDGSEGYYARHMDGAVWFHEAATDRGCGGTGSINCYCGGDLCVCGNNGSIECDGCEDCERDDDGFGPEDDQ